MSLKNIDLSKIKVAEKPYEKPKNQYKGNVNCNFLITTHVTERFAERFLNNLNYNLDQVKEFMTALINERGIEGFGHGKTNYVAVPHHGIFVIQDNSVVTFLDERNLNYRNQDLYIKLLNKGRIK